MAKVTQKEVIMYQLILNRWLTPEKYLSPGDLWGEVYVKPLKAWGFVSWEVSARMSEIKKENPNLLEIKQVKSRAGTKYNTYRIKAGAKKEDVVTTKLQKLYQKIRPYKKAIIKDYES